MAEETKAKKAKKAIDWSRDLCERLCDLYQNEELLYTLTHSQYHNRNARIDAWSRIAEALSVDGISGMHNNALFGTCTCRFDPK